VRDHYDWVILTPVSAFYKVSLYNELASNFKILVVVVAATSQQRHPDFYGTKRLYTEIVLWPGHLERRDKSQTLRQLKKIMHQISYDKLLVGGWDLPEFWWAVFTSPIAKNVLALESSCYESQTVGLKAWIKRRFLARIQTIIASGAAQQRLAQQLGFSKSIFLSHGVGLFHYGIREAQRETMRTPTRFLFVGRLAPEKNLMALLEAFSNFPALHLTIVGDGPLNTVLRASAGPNIQFVGHVANQQLAILYQGHDVFILPSLSEPWGLVVEEALYYGLPLIVSDRVGCVEDLVLKPKTGLVFNVQDTKSLQKAILQIQDPTQYAQFCQAAAAFDFQARDKLQVACYADCM
jgi:glycosyltransferase involved in cell wall biosynthesis